jgi:hypothetical protein
MIAHLCRSIHRTQTAGLSAPFFSAAAHRWAEIFATDEGHRLNIAEAIAGLAREPELYLCGPMRLLDRF